ncbi:hypothetical protein JCM10213_000500 [Rhodosporidiobolus nylandii]
MASFIFPPPLSSTPALPQPAHSPSDSIFRLDRPHALPESYLAVRDSLTQEQVDSLSASLAAALPSWAPTLSPAASPTKSSSSHGGGTGSGGAGGFDSEATESAIDPEEWARQRRLSMILSGLGMVLGSASLSLAAGPVLEMQDEEREGEREPHGPASQSHLPSPASAKSCVSASAGPWLQPSPRFEEGASGEEAFESADEGEDRFWSAGRRTPGAEPRSSSSRSGESSGRRSRRSSRVGEVPQTTSTIIDTSPLVPHSALLGAASAREEDLSASSPSSPSASAAWRAVSPEVSFGYACGEPGNETDEFDAGAEADEDEDDDHSSSATSIEQLVRRSWRLSSQADLESGAAARRRDSKRVSVRPVERRDRFLDGADPGLGIKLELLDFLADGSGTVRAGATASSYTPSSRPLARLSVVDTFPVKARPPAEPSFLPELPTSPPLVAGPPSPLPSFALASNSRPALSPIHSVSSSPSLLSSEPSPSSPTLSSATSRSSQPRSSSLATSISTSAVPPSEPRPARARTGSGDVNLSRRGSVIGNSLSSSKSTRRLSAFISSGIEHIRSRTSSYNSNDGERDEQPPVQEVRAARRRSRTDGPISAPLPSAPFPPAPRIRRAATPPPVSSSRPSPALKQPSTLSAAPPAPSLSQSPLSGRTWRSTLTDVEYERLSLAYGPLEMRRQEVIWELCETERSFVNGLRGVIQVFTLPLRTRSGAWIKGVPVAVSRLLDWLDDIVYLHSQISAALDAAREAQYPVVLKLAEAFLPFVQRLEVHQPYLVRFEAVTRSIDEMTADMESDFGEFVRMQSSLPECGALSLSSFLLKPVQRLMKYPLFFKQLCDLTPAPHPDHFSVLTLLHSTDAMIRALQEVKTREDEYEEAKVLEARIRGLPSGFALAARDRRLVAHGILRRVHINDRDRGVLEMDAMARAGRRGAALRGGAPSPPSLTIPVPPPTSRQSRPHSTLSDSGSSSTTTYTSSADASNSSSAGWTPPTTPGSALPASPATAGGFAHLRPDSMISNASSTYSDDYAGPPSSSAGRLVKTRAKESSVHVFVFSDLIVLATKQADPGRFIRDAAAKAKRGSRETREESERRSPPVYRVLEGGVGVARVLGVADLSGKTEHDHLIEVDLLPVLSSPGGKHADSFAPLSLSNTALATSLYFTLPSPSSAARSPISPTLSSTPSPSSASGPLFTERLRWLQAFERSYLFALRSLSFPSAAHAHSASSDLLSDPRSSYISAGIIPKSPSEQALELGRVASAGGEEVDPAQAEREERGWWAVRLKKVRKELEGSLPPLASASTAPGPPAAWAPAGGKTRRTTTGKPHALLETRDSASTALGLVWGGVRADEQPAQETPRRRSS